MNDRSHIHRWNSGRSQVPLCDKDTLFEGFDCEDSVQSFIQIVQTIILHFEPLLRCAFMSPLGLLGGHHCVFHRCFLENLLFQRG